MNQPHISQLREQLLATLSDLRNRDRPMEPDRARAVATVAAVLVDSARVEVEYLKVTGQDSVPFLGVQEQVGVAGDETPPTNGITAITRHRLRG